MNGPPSAGRDLAAIDEHYAQFTRATADRGLAAVFRAADYLTRYPLAGTRGKWPATRHRVIKTYPYTIVYRIRPRSIQVLRVLHQSRKFFNQ